MAEDLITILNKSLDKRTKLPLYLQFVNIVKTKIDNGEITKGEFFPSEREFASHLDISRITIRKALKELEEQKYIIRQQGYGTYVNGSLEYSLKNIKGFSEQVRLQGKQPKTLWLNKQLISVDTEIAAKLNLKKGSQIYVLERIRYIDDVPVSIEKSYVPTNIIGNAAEIELSLYNHFHSRNIFPTHVKSWISTILPDDEFLETMQLKELTPVLLIKQLVLDENEQPIEYSENCCRGDKYVFTSEE